MASKENQPPSEVQSSSSELENISETLATMKQGMSEITSVLKSLTAWRNQVEASEQVSIDGGSDFDEDEPPSKKAKHGAPRGPCTTTTDTAGSKVGSNIDLPCPGSSRGPDEDLLSLLGNPGQEEENNLDSLNILSEALGEEERLGDPINEKLANIINKHFFEAKSKDKLKEIINKYNLPSNCKDIGVTKVSAEVWRACSPLTRETDLKFQNVQKTLVSALIPLTKMAEKILKLSQLFSKNDLSELLTLSSDTIALLCSANREINYRRREAIKPDLQADYKLLCSSQVPVTKQLFGDNLQNDMNEIKNAAKLTKSLSKQNTPNNNPTLSGKRWHSGSKPGQNTKRGKHFLSKGRRPHYPTR